MKDLKPLVDKLINQHCLRLREVPTDSAGRPPSPIVEVNPELLESIRTIRTNASGQQTGSDSANSANQPDEPSDTEPSGPGDSVDDERADAELDDLLTVEVGLDH